MATGAQRLSQNMAAISYAMELTKPLEVNVDSGQVPGPLQRRRQDPERVSPEDMSLELEPGKPLKNFGRRLAYEAGIPLPYNMRQAEEAAEQASIDYENENAWMAQMATTFDSQMSDNAANAADPAERRVYQQYQQSGADAARAFFAEGASPEQRAGALGQFVKLGTEARQVLNADSNERTKFVRQYLASELGTSRTGIIQIDMAEKDRVLSTESELAQLDNVAPGSVEEQAVLRAMLGTATARTQSTMTNLAQAGGAVAGALSANPYALAAGAGLQALGSFLAKEDLKLDRDTVVRMVVEQNDALDRLTGEFRPEVVRLHDGVVKDAERYGIPSQSWSAEPIKLSTPYMDAYRQRLFPGANSGEPNLPRPVPQNESPSTPPMERRDEGGRRRARGARPTNERE